MVLQCRTIVIGVLVVLQVNLQRRNKVNTNLVSCEAIASQAHSTQHTAHVRSERLGSWCDDDD